MIKLEPTNEQYTAIQAAQTGKSLAIKAFAGAAKTSTCIMIADALPHPSLYVAFNKAIADEAGSKFPSWVTCSTMHSLAWKAIVKNMKSGYAKKLQGFFDFKDVDAIMATMNLGFSRERELDIKLTVIDVIKSFCQSDTKSLFSFLSEYTKGKEPARYDYVTAIALAYWENLIDESNPTKITHDVYLKLFQISMPVLSFKTIYLDEAQDSNPVTLDIVLSQKLYGSQVILVGDEYQAIYEWRGAVNAMEGLGNSCTEMYLTESFRFTQEIADMASKLTAIVGNTREIIGRAAPATVIDGYVTLSSGAHFIASKAIIVRNNSTLLSELLKAETEGKKVFVLADLKELWSKMYHINALHFGTEIKYPDKELSQYKTEAELKEASESMPELKRLVSLTIQLGTGGLYKNIERIKSVIVLDKDRADYTLTTCHKSKGLEWEEVTLCEDLLTIPEGVTKEEVLFDNQTINLIYVGLTRAKYKVNLPESIKEVIENWKYYHSEYVGKVAFTKDKIKWNEKAV